MGAATGAMRREAVLCFALSVALATYVALHAAGRPLFVYLPVERAFVWEARSGAIGMAYFGYVANAAIAASLASFAGRLTPLGAVLEPKRALLRAALVATMAVALVYFAVVESTKWIF